MATTMSRKDKNRFMLEVIKGSKQLSAENFEDAATFIKDSQRQTSTLGKVWKFFAIVLAAVIVLFLIKLSNTSEMALRYSNQAQEEMGVWMIGIFGLTMWTLLLFWLSRTAKKNTQKLREKLVSALRSELAGATPDQKAVYESQLRELGA